MQENPFSDNILTFKICVNWCLLSPVPNLVINGHSPRYHKAEKGTLVLQLYWGKSHGLISKFNLVEHKNDYVSSWYFLMEKKKFALEFFFIVCPAFAHCFSVIPKYLLHFSVSKSSIFNAGRYPGVDTAESVGSQT